MPVLKRISRALRALLASRVPALVRLLPATAPLLAQRYLCRAGSPARELLVCLPGIGDTADDYEARGFVAALRASGHHVDMMTADAHFGYYADRSLVERLRTDVIRPARARGYDKIGLLGISLGGLGALLYAQAHPEDVAGLVVLAPFLGKTVADDIVRAGGLAQWRGASESGEDYERRLWTWLKGYVTHPAGMPPLHLAFGSRDRFARANRLLAAVLPESQVHMLPGRHNWTTWRRLWRGLLAAGFGFNAHPMSRD